MCPPLSLPHTMRQVCYLWKALYGLKQTSHVWFERFNLALLQLGFINLPYDSDSALFTHKFLMANLFLLLYIDDMIITKDYSNGIAFIKDYLVELFEMKFILYVIFLVLKSTYQLMVISRLRLNMYLIYLIKLNRDGFTNKKTISTLF